MLSLHRSLLVTGVTVLACLAPGGASRAANADAPAERINYRDHIQPLFRKRCFTCHNEAQAKSDLDLTAYRAAMAGGSSGEVLVPGDASQSRLYLLASHAERPHMPPKGRRMKDDELALLKRWIEGGLLETRSGKPRAPAVKSVLALKPASIGKPAGGPPMPKDLPTGPVARIARGGAITALAASPWAPLVAVGGQKQVLLYHTQSLVRLGVLAFPEGRPLAVRFSRNGKLLLAAGGRGGDSGRVVVWDVTTGKRAFEIGDDELDVVLAADLTADHATLALGSADHFVKIYSTTDGVLRHKLKKHTDWIAAARFSPDGKLLAIGDRSAGLVIWEVKTGDVFHTLRGHRAAINGVAWRSDSRVLASAGEDGIVKLWDAREGSLAKGFTAHPPGVLSMAFSHDGRLATCGRDRATKLWDTNGALIREFEPAVDLATRVALTFDAARLVTGDFTGALRVFNTADGAKLGNLSPQR